MIKFLPILLVLLIVFCPGSGAFGQDLSYTGSALWSFATDVEISGTYAYGAFKSGLAVYDISNPTSPSMISRCYIPGEPFNIFLSGNYAFIITENEGLQIVDISNPSSPTLTGTYENSQWLRDVFVQGEYAFLSGYSGFLDIVNIANPAAPFSVIYCDYIPAKTAFVRGDYAYIAGVNTSADNLLIVHLDFPNNPSIVSQRQLESNITEITVIGNYAYIIEGSPAAAPYLDIFDISDPANPGSIGTCFLGGQPTDLAVDGDRAYIANMINGLQLVDITNPASPSLLGNFGLSPLSLLGAAKSANYVYAFDEYRGLEIFDIADSLTATVIAECRASLPLYRMAIAGSYGYVTTPNLFFEQGFGLSIVDLSGMSDPVEVGTVSRSMPMGIAVRGNYLYISDLGLKLFNIANPTDPVAIGSMGTPAPANKIAIRGDYAYLSQSSYASFNGLEIVNISDPANPTFVDTISVGGANDIFLSGRYAYIAHDNRNAASAGMAVVDIDDPANPTLVADYTTNRTAYGIYVAGNYAYLSSGGLFILDISDPANPALTSSMALSHQFIYDVVVIGNYAYLANWGGSIIVINIADPGNPTQESEYSVYAPLSLESNGNSLFVVGNHALTKIRISGGTSICPYAVGDVNNSGVFTGLDVSYSIRYLKGGSPPPYSCECTTGNSWYVAGDVNGSCGFDGLDISCMVGHCKRETPFVPCPDCPPGR